MVFNYEDNDNYATIEFDGNSWAAKGRKSGTNVDIELNESNLPELQADKNTPLNWITKEMIHMS